MIYRGKILKKLQFWIWLCYYFGMKTKKTNKLTQLDIYEFDNICLDDVYITVGNNKLLRNKDLSIFNQIAGYYDSIGKLNKFSIWLCHKYNLNLGDVIPHEIIMKWENLLITRQRSLIYIEALRIKYSSNGIIDFYGITNDCVVHKITSTDQKVFYPDLIRYLKFHEIPRRMCEELNIDKIITKSDKEIKNDIEICLENSLFKKIDNIKILSNGKKEFCLAHYSFKLGKVYKETPAWDSFINQLFDDGSRQCFMAFVYSVFKAENRGRQLLYLYGPGNTGKSMICNTIANRLKKLNSNIVASLPNQFNEDKHTLASLVGKRLITAPDTVDRALVRNKLIKNITGNDDVAVRKMFSIETQENIYSKIIATSNSRPWVIVDREEEISRILYIPIDSTLSLEAKKTWHTIYPGIDWGKKLETEIDDFIAKCKEHYNALLLPDGHNIKPYDGMNIKLESSKFHIQRDQLIWWEKCLQPYTGMGITNALTITDLCKDYCRFVGTATGRKKNEDDYYIRSFMCTMIKNKGIAIKALDIGNVQYIAGWEFQERFKEKRPTMAKEIEKQLDRVTRYGYGGSVSTNIDGRF